MKKHLRDHQYVKVVTDEVKVKKMVARPLYKQHVIYDEEMVAIQLKKTIVILNKPRYLGMTILGILKLVMYKFPYEFIMKKYPRTKLMFTDTDRFCYWIPTESNIFEDICAHHE